MAYRIELRARARQALERLAEQMTPQIYDGLWDAADSLAELPERCALVPEPKLRAKRVRHLYGRGRHVYRIIYRIRDERVEILTIRHARRRHLESQPVTESTH